MISPTLLRSAPTLALVPHRSVLSIAGPQASQFLNGLITSTVPKKGPFFSTLLQAQGKVLYDVFIYPHTAAGDQPRYLIEHDSRISEAPPLLSMLRRYVLRSKVELKNVSEEYDVWASWGSEREQVWESPRKWTWANSGVVEPAWDHTDEWPWGVQDLILRDRRAVGMGRRMLIKKGDLPPEASSYDIAHSDTYTVHRILHGVPEGMQDIQPMQAYPMESNLDVMGGVDFRKGCYVGQELTVRTYHTGVIRKRILPVAIHKPDERPQKIVSPSTALQDLLTNITIRASRTAAPDDNRPASRIRGTGKLLSSMHGVGLALLRLEHVEGVHKGDIKLEFEVENGEQEKMQWALSPWWPCWWPRRTSEKIA